MNLQDMNESQWFEDLSPSWGQKATLLITNYFCNFRVKTLCKVKFILRLGIRVRHVVVMVKINVL